MEQFCQYYFNQKRSKIISEKTLLEHKNYVKNKLNDIILNSCVYEGDDNINNFNSDIINYLISLDKNEPIDLVKLKPIYENIRSDDEGIGTEVYQKNNITLIKSYWFGANHNDITIEKLQNLINSFYNSLSNPRTWKDILLAFQYYIVFEKIHPFPDYNGRIGRLIFLEHPFEYINFPVSNALNKLCISQDDLFNTTLKTYYYKNNELYYYKNNEKYIYKKYNFNESDLETLTDKQLIKINEIIVKSILINLFEKKYVESLKQYFKYVKFTPDNFIIDYENLEIFYENWRYKNKFNIEYFYNKFP